MKQTSTLFLKIVILLIALGTIVALFWFPQTEGRASNLDLLSIYLDPIIIFGYIASIPFFIALSQAFKLLGYIEQNKTFSQASVTALKNIKYCVFAFIGFIILGEIIISTTGGDEDKAGIIALGIYTTFASIVIATATAVFQRLLQNAVDMKSENDLTV